MTVIRVDKKRKFFDRLPYTIMGPDRLLVMMNVLAPAVVYAIPVIIVAHSHPNVRAPSRLPSSHAPMNPSLSNHASRPPQPLSMPSLMFIGSVLLVLLMAMGVIAKILLPKVWLRCKKCSGSFCDSCCDQSDYVQVHEESDRARERRHRGGWRAPGTVLLLSDASRRHSWKEKQRRADADGARKADEANWANSPEVTLLRSIAREWTEPEDTLLRERVRQHGADWVLISNRYIPDRSPQDIESRWQQLTGGPAAAKADDALVC